MTAPIIVVASIIIALDFFAEKPCVFRAVVTLATGFSDLVFLMCISNL